MVEVAVVVVAVVAVLVPVGQVPGLGLVVLLALLPGAPCLRASCSPSSACWWCTSLRA
jgi:hypothetical protein